MKVILTARWGSFKPGETVDVGESLGEWLIGRNLAKAISQPPKDKMVRSSQTKGIASAPR